jgi:hypothetical protein
MSVSLNNPVMRDAKVQELTEKAAFRRFTRVWTSFSGASAAPLFANLAQNAYSLGLRTLFLPSKFCLAAATRIH